MNLLEARDKLAAVLTPVEDTDPQVFASLVDAVQPPALVLSWAPVAVEPDTSCWYIGHLVITCVVARLMPGEGLTTMEELWAYVRGRLAGDSDAWPIESIGGAQGVVIAKTNYLASRITVRVRVTFT